MNFFIAKPLYLLALLAIAACSGSSNDPALDDKKSVQKPLVTEDSSSSEPTVTAPAQPTPAPVADLAPEFTDLPEPYRSANYSRGRRTFKLCASCHTLTEDGPNLVGPNLHGLFGREAGSVEGFRYSDAIQESGIVWSPEDLEQWLVSPRGFLPGNNMNFNGVRRPSDRTAVIAYIMVETGWEQPE